MKPNIKVKYLQENSKKENSKNFYLRKKKSQISVHLQPRLLANIAPDDLNLWQV